MRRGLPILALLLPAIAACAEDRLRLLDQELLTFKLEHERGRREELEERLDVEQAKTRDLTRALADLLVEKARLEAEIAETLRRLREEKAALEGDEKGAPTPEAPDDGK